jgi:hypothetical protein
MFLSRWCSSARLGAAPFHLLAAAAQSCGDVDARHAAGGACYCYPLCLHNLQPQLAAASQLGGGPMVVLQAAGKPAQDAPQVLQSVQGRPARWGWVPVCHHVLEQQHNCTTVRRACPSPSSRGGTPLCNHDHHFWAYLPWLSGQLWDADASCNDPAAVSSSCLPEKEFRSCQPYTTLQWLRSR